MSTAHIKQSLSLVFLALFLTTKMAGLHALTHDDSDLNDDCAICHVIGTDHQTPVVLLEPDEFVPVIFYPVLQNQILSFRPVLLQDDLHSYYLFSRPPPVS